MTNRISIEQIETAVAHLNKITGNPETPYTRQEDGSFKPNAGNWHISQAYGGVCVQQMCDGGGSREPIWTGHVPKKEAFQRLHSFINGYEAGKA